jgi:hypothetical protein
MQHDHEYVDRQMSRSCECSDRDVVSQQAARVQRPPVSRLARPISRSAIHLFGSSRHSNSDSLNSYSCPRIPPAQAHVSVPLRLPVLVPALDLEPILHLQTTTNPSHDFRASSPTSVHHPQRLQRRTSSSDLFVSSTPSPPATSYPPCIQFNRHPAEATAHPAHLRLLCVRRRCLRL